jgi:toxin ParE1/3/4
MIRRTPRAVESLIALATYIGADREDAAERFIAAVEATLANLERMPGMGRAWEPAAPALAGIRFCLVSGFPNYLVFYLAVQGGIEVVDVIHGAQDLDQRLG